MLHLLYLLQQCQYMFNLLQCEDHKVYHKVTDQCKEDKN
jgi:hypothetical protein